MAENQFIKTPEPKLKFAYELTQKLKASGTGSEKLDIVRRLLVTNRNATALEGLAVLEEQYQVRRLTDVTIEKARSLVFTGELPPAKVDDYEPVEDAIHTQNIAAAEAAKKEPQRQQTHNR